MAEPSGAPQPGEPLSLADREEILDQTLIAMTTQKGRVETRGQTSAVVVFGKPVNHVLHLLLLIFTCSLWGPVWLLVAAFSGERRTTVSVDQYGVASKHQAPMPTHRVVLIVIAVLWAVMNFAIPVSIIAATGFGALTATIGSLVGHPGSQSSAPGTTQTSEPAPSTRPAQLPGAATTTPVPVDPESSSLNQLKATANADRPFVTSSLADRWVAQVSSKRPGLKAEGIVWDNTQILREHLQLRQQYPGARLLWSGDWSNFSAKDFWVTVVGIGFPDQSSAQAWCTDHNLDRDHCFPTLIRR
jgi:hypothetical protein